MATNNDTHADHYSSLSQIPLGVKYLGLFLLNPSKREKNMLVLLSLYVFLREVC